jgi:hypothetical protein
MNRRRAVWGKLRWGLMSAPVVVPPAQPTSVPIQPMLTTSFRDCTPCGCTAPPPWPTLYLGCLSQGQLSLGSLFLLYPSLLSGSCHLRCLLLMSVRWVAHLLRSRMPSYHPVREERPIDDHAAGGWWMLTKWWTSVEPVAGAGAVFICFKRLLI